MNARSQTAQDLANALLGMARVSQTVHRCSSSFGSRLGPRHVVLVIPEGETTGDYYECSDRVLALLNAGMSPVDLELDALTDDETEAFDNGTYWEG